MIEFEANLSSPVSGQSDWTPWKSMPLDVMSALATPEISVMARIVGDHLNGAVTIQGSGGKYFDGSQTIQTRTRLVGKGQPQLEIRVVPTTKEVK